MATMSQQSLISLLAKCGNLKKLSLESVPINSAVCAEIGNNRKLEALNLTMCTGIDEHGITNLLPELKSYVPSYIRSYNAQTIISSLRNFRLENFNISWTSLNTQSVDAFLEYVPRSLLRLNIAGCRKSLTDFRMFYYHNLQNLNKLKLLFFVDINILATRCPDLIELDISDCVNLSSDCIDRLVKFKQLEFLSMSRCYNVAPASYV